MGEKLPAIEIDGVFISLEIFLHLINHIGLKHNLETKFIAQRSLFPLCAFSDTSDFPALNPTGNAEEIYREHFPINTCK